MRRCAKCGLPKADDEFYRHKGRSTGFSAYCKECDKSKQRAYNATHTAVLQAYNRQRDKAHLKIWRAENYQKRAEWIKSAARAFAKTHRVQINQRQQHRYQAVPAVRLALLLRNRLNLALKRDTKAGSAVKLLGCSVRGLQYWLEKHFEPGMSWSNQGIGTGKWHIDHVRPLSSFNLLDPSQLSEACHFTNLQPLWSEDNLRKGGAKTVWPIS